METVSAADRRHLGVGFVLVAGPSLWWGGERGDTTDWFVVMAVLWLCIPITVFSIGAGAGGVVWSVLLLCGSAAFAVPVVVWGLTRRWMFGTRAYIVLPVRLAAAAVIAIGLERGAGSRLIGLSVFGLLAGCEASLSLRAVGIEISFLEAARRFLLSGLNLGVVLGLGVVVAVAGAHAAPVAIGVYAALWFELAMVLGVVATLQVSERVVMDDRRAVQDAVREQERRQRAHWIHDDVCAELRTVRLRLDAEVLAASDVARELGDLDHRLRLRQLDEHIESGTVRLAELVQPYVRMLQDRGITLGDVPRFDSGTAELDADTAVLVRRAVSVPVANALNAGATRIGVRAEVSDRSISIEVDDDAGGFRLEDTPAGRGLDSLRHDVADLAVSVDRGVTTVRVTVARRPLEQPARRRLLTRAGETN